MDEGRTWAYLPQDPTEGEAYSLYADPDSTERLLISDYDTIFFSSDGGVSFRAVFTTNDCHVAGVFFDGDEIFVGTRAGLLVSINAGSSFSMAAFAGLPVDEAMLSFAGARQNGIRRLFCITKGRNDVWPAITGLDHWGFRGIYRLDVTPNAAWTRTVAGIGPGDHPFFFSMARDRIDIAYVAGGSDSNLPIVFKTADGGASWHPVLHTRNNANVRTGWQGEGGDRQWTYAESVLGLAVSPTDPDRVLITDLGFAHLTVDGGQNCSQRYVDGTDENPAGSPTPTRKSYQSVGLENTSCWWLTWSSETNLFACFTDIHGLRSTDGGVKWSFDFSGQQFNSSFHAVRQPATGRLFLAVSSIHDLYQSTYLDDESIDGGEGGILYSDDRGATWQTLHDFGHPVIWLALDPNDANRLYASVVHQSDGGIYVTQNAGAGPNATWARLTNPPRTEGHPFNIQVLRDGTLVATYSGRREGDVFTRSSGLFISSDAGQSWEDRSDPGMVYWTGDVVFDPHDAAEQTWYVGVSSGWGGPPNGLGGLYRTKDRGATWTRINVLNRVRSCTIDPADPDGAYLTTEEDGLWFTSNLTSAQPAFSEVSGYSFKNPLRVFFNPYQVGEVWVTSFGNGLRVGRMESEQLRFVSPSFENGRFGTQIQAPSGQEVIVSASADLKTWSDISTNTVSQGGIRFEEPAAGAQARRFYRARLRAE